jgi:hypothetical protein
VLFRSNPQSAQLSKFNHWKTLIDTLEKNTQIVAISRIVMAPIHPAKERGGKKFIHAARVDVTLGSMLKDNPKITLETHFCLEHQDACPWEIVECPPDLD